MDYWNEQALRELRDDAMVELKDADWTYADIGRVFGIKDWRQVRRIISRTRERHNAIDRLLAKMRAREAAEMAKYTRIHLANRAGARNGRDS